MDHLIIVDCQYDFIDGSLACSHSQEAVRNIIAFANANDVKCMYTSDWHSKTNKSFKINGGIWPVHCVAGSRGAEVSDEFNQMNEGNRPGKDNIFYKGKNDDVEEYSACLAVNSSGIVLSECVSPHVYVTGIAAEYCVKETVLGLLEKGIKVTVLKDCLGYVSEDDYRKSLADMKEKGAEVL